VVNGFPPQASIKKNMFVWLPNGTRSALLAGGAGGIGALWAKHLSVESLILLGRSLREAVGPMKVVEQLMRGAWALKISCTFGTQTSFRNYAVVLHLSSQTFDFLPTRVSLF